MSKILLAMAGLLLVPLFFAVFVLRKMLAGPIAADGTNIFVYSQVIWDEVWQRPQQYAWISAEKCPTIYCCPVQVHNLLYLKDKWKPVRIINEDGRRLVVLSPLVFSGHFKSRLIHELNCRLTAATVNLALGRGTRLRALVNTPFAVRVLQHIKPARTNCPKRIERLVFDVIDDFTVFDWSPDFGKAFDRELTAMADAVIAGTHELAAARTAVPFIACGVDFDLFHTPQPAPAELQSLARPVIGYFGTISERIDLGLIDRIAAEFPAASVVMVGPVHFPAHDLPRRDNLHFLGLRRHAELPAFAQAFDVGLIPFRITEATTRLNPVKTLEYLAAGLPVVATALPDLQRFYSDLISIASCHSEFIQLIRNELEARDEARIARGIERARDASWRAMVDEINAVLFAGAPGGESCISRNSASHAAASPSTAGAARS